MIFNSKSRHTFKFGGAILDNVLQYRYLGILLNKAGTFTSAIKDLTERAKQAYYKMRYLTKNSNLSPKFSVKLFDALVKPIALYCSEIWGGFGVKENKSQNLLNWLFELDSSP